MRQVFFILVASSATAALRLSAVSGKAAFHTAARSGVAHLSVAADTAAALRALTGAAKDDVRGIARPDAAVPILPACTYWIGAAFRKWLGSDDPIAVGRDPRLSSEELSTAFCRGAGARDAGPATTPAMLESLLGPSAEYVGSVMVTASHLPAEWNGLKFFARPLGRGLNKQEVRQVMELAVQLCEAGGAVDGTSPVPVHDGFMRPYVEKLQAAVRSAAGGDDAAPLRGMRVCVNPGNGAGGFFASAVLVPLGADTSASINLEPDGSFPAHMHRP